MGLVGGDLPHKKVIKNICERKCVCVRVLLNSLFLNFVVAVMSAVCTCMNQ